MKAFRTENLHPSRKLSHRLQSKFTAANEVHNRKPRFTAENHSSNHEPSNLMSSGNVYIRKLMCIYMRSPNFSLILTLRSENYPFTLKNSNHEHLFSLNYHPHPLNLQLFFISSRTPTENPLFSLKYHPKSFESP